MKELQENIIRIKELMLIEQKEQQMSLFSNESKPITVNSDEFTKKFKEKVYFILRDLYRGDKWSKDRSRGPGGGGGVVNVHTVYDLLKKKGLEGYSDEGGDWSILNYFDTNPMVRRTIIGLYEKETGNVIDNEDIMNDFISWMSKNRNKIFTDGPILNDLMEKNIESLYQGELNEKSAFDFLKTKIENMTNWELMGKALPGSVSDREGVDIKMKNKKTGAVATFQVKPLGNLKRTGKFYIVKSYNIKNLDKKPVNYFIFTSSDKEGVFIFRNTKGKYTILDKDTVQFEEPPIEF